MKTVKVLLLLLFVSCTTIESVEIVDDKYQKAYFAGGCFWCMEPPFEALEGVIGATSGYMGGTVENPTYEEVTTGETGHAEVVEILFDPEIVTYEELLEVFWRNIDPTALNYHLSYSWTIVYNSISFYSTCHKHIAFSYFANYFTWYSTL